MSPYRKHPNNPLLSGLITHAQNLTVDTFIDTDAVTVADSSVFNVGEPVEIGDDNSALMLTQIRWADFMTVTVGSNGPATVDDTNGAGRGTAF